MLQLIIISPLAHKKARMRQKPNKLQIGISFWLQSIPTHPPLILSQMVLNREDFLFCLKPKTQPKKNLQKTISLYVKVFAATVTSKCNQTPNQRWNANQSTSSTELNAGWNRQESALLQESWTGIWLHGENSSSSSSASKIQNVEGLRSQHHPCQHMKQGGSLNKGKEPARRDQKSLCYYWT